MHKHRARDSKCTSGGGGGVQKQGNIREHAQQQCKGVEVHDLTEPSKAA
jgi:hypothetical protein